MNYYNIQLIISFKISNVDMTNINLESWMTKFKLWNQDVSKIYLQILLNLQERKCS